MSSSSFGSTLQTTFTTFFKWNLLYIVSILQYLISPNDALGETGFGFTVSSWKRGIRDGNSFSKLLPLFKKSPVFKETLRRSIVLNLGIFFTFLVVEYAVAPLFNGAFSQAFSWVVWLLYKMYQYPFLLTALVINSNYYNQFAREGYKVTRHKEPSKESSFLNTSASWCFYMHFTTWASIIAYVPYLGWIFSFIWLTFVNSYTIFDYLWGLQNLNVLKRLEYFAGHSIYLFGFAMIPTLAFKMFSDYLNPVLFSSLFSVVFPMYILLSQVAKPTGEFDHLKSTV